MKRMLCFAYTVLGVSVFAAGKIEGTWVSVDDETGQKKSHIEISRDHDGRYSGKVIKLLLDPDFRCTACDGSRKDQPVQGMTVLWGLKKKGDKYVDGQILDPKKGKIYKAKVHLAENDTHLIVRGHLAFSSLFGRSQTWIRLN